MEDVIQPPEEAFGPRLTLIRRRRKYFFATVVLYMPAMWSVQYYSPKYLSMGAAIALWIVILFTTMILAAVVKCPRCGNYFHMHGMSLLYLRKCLHCQLHINADRKG